MNPLSFISIVRMRRISKSFSLMLVFPFLLSSCNVIKLVHLMKSGEVKQDAYFQEIPLQDQDKMILTEVSINGVTYHFVLDTGAPTMLSDELAGKTSAKEKCHVPSSDSQGNKSTMSFSKIEKINVGEIEYLDQGVAIYDFDQMRELSCFEFDGILGANTMKSSIWQFDLKNNLIRIANSVDSFSIPDNALRFKFIQQITGTPVLSLKINGIAIPGVILDYGSNSGIEVVSASLCDSIDINNIPSERTFGCSSLGLYGGKYDTLYTSQFSEISIDEHKFTDVPVHISKSGESTIGTDFLKNFLVTVDWSQGMVYMEKTGNEPPAKEKVPFGFGAIWKDGKLIVVKLIEGSPAHLAGLQLGDQILSINDVDYSQIQPDQYCDIIRNGLIREDTKAIQLVFKSDTVTKELNMLLNN